MRIFAPKRDDLLVYALLILSAVSGRQMIFRRLGWWSDGGSRPHGGL